MTDAQPALATRVMHSDYMHFAKVHSHARYNLATSGVADCRLSDLEVSADDLALHGQNPYGFAPLTEQVAARFGIDPAFVVMAGGGCSFANYLAAASLVAPGDEVLIEDPTYGLLSSMLGFLQAKLILAPRRLEADWALEPEAFVEKITAKTRLIVLTNLHNPSSALADPAAISAIAAAAAKVGAYVMIDEIYLELLFRDEVAQTAFVPEGPIIVTSGLTKAYGLSGLRCGWILAPRAIAERMRQLNNLFSVLPAHISETLALRAFQRLPELRRRANALIDQNRAAYHAILGGHPRLHQSLFGFGTTVFPKLLDGDVEALFETLTREAETSFVPGRFFNRSNHFRIGLAGDVAMTRTGLERLATALG